MLNMPQEPAIDAVPTPQPEGAEEIPSVMESSEDSEASGETVPKSEYTALQKTRRKKRRRPKLPRTRSGTTVSHFAVTHSFATTT
jgi:hypothetical protein